MPWLVARRSRTLSSAWSPCRCRRPMPPITHMPCGSTKIWPSSLLARADDVAEVVVRAPEPGAVPAVLDDHAGHLLRLGPVTCGVVGQAAQLGDPGELPGGEDEQAGDEHRLGHTAVRVRRRLERLSRSLGETIEVQAVVPVGPPDERQAVRPEPVEGVARRAFQVLVEGRGAARGVVVAAPVRRGSGCRPSPSGRPRQRARARADRR